MSLLDNELKKRAYPGQLPAAICILFISFFLMICLPIIMSGVISYTGTINADFEFRQDAVDMIVTLLNWYGYAMIGLALWVLINSLQGICDKIDWIQERAYYRKWGSC